MVMSPARHLRDRRNFARDAAYWRPVRSLAMRQRMTREDRQIHTRVRARLQREEESR